MVYTVPRFSHPWKVTFLTIAGFFGGEGDISRKLRLFLAVDKRLLCYSFARFLINGPGVRIHLQIMPLPRGRKSKTTSYLSGKVLCFFVVF
jgi:hypothetical protein